MSSRGTGLIIVALVWAAIYLPALGSLEIRGEEGRRILPAVTMLETGDYLVPQVGSERYFSKPPLINWMVALSFKIFGARNEWTARLPSALCVLAVAIAFAMVARQSLGALGSTIAALIWLTNWGIIEKGRLIEIEGIYVSLFALAFVCWISWWNEERSPWLIWCLPWIFLGLGLLAKGPIHIFFFYVLIIAILWETGRLRTIWNIPHAVGLIIMMSIFAAWAIPCAHAASGTHMTKVWRNQMWLALSEFHLKGWLLNLPRSLGYFLPWIFLLPFGLTARFSSERPPRIIRAIAWSTILLLVIVDLIPGWQPRYNMPLLAPAAWLLATILNADELRWSRWFGGKMFSMQHRRRAVAAIAIITCIVVLVAALTIVPRFQERQKVKAIAARIESVVPQAEMLYAVDPDFQPFLFYVHRPISYVTSVADLPRAARYFLVQSENREVAEKASQWLPLHPAPVLFIEDYRYWKTIVFAVPE